MLTLYSDKNFTKQQLTSLFKSVGWESGNFPDKLYNSVMTSETVISLKDEHSGLAALMTAVSDGGMNVFFPYLLVDPDYQKQGAGITIMSEMLNYYKGYYRKILICNQNNIGFYEKCGMNLQSDLYVMMQIE